MRNQIIYPHLGVYAGPAPSHTGHFIGGDGAINNSWDSVNNGSLVFPLKRVIESSYSISCPRINISNLGEFGTISRPMLNETQVQLNINYLLMGLINEMRLGLLANVPLGISGQSLIYGTGNVSPISGLYSRDYSVTNELGYINWPLVSREPRNMFIAIEKTNVEFNSQSAGSTLQNLYNNTNIDVYGFGDCFLSSYSCSASVSDMPTVSIGMTASNVEVYSSGLCCDIPSVIPATCDTRSGTKFSIPNNFEGSGLPTVMIPKDISLSIIQRSNSSTQLSNLLFKSSELKIQGFNFNFDLPRSPLYSLGARLPYDKKIQMPVICNLNINSIAGDSSAGSLANLVKNDEKYDISIRLNYQVKSLFTGVGICYNFIGARFNDGVSSSSLSSRQNFNYSFSVPMSPEDSVNGFFMTGYLGIPFGQTEDVLLSDDFDGGGIDVLLMEDDSPFSIGATGYRLLY